MEESRNTQLFYSLVYTFQMQAWMSMGKLKNPVTDKVDRDLNAAQLTIDMIDMIKEKTKGNLNDQENKFIEQVLADLKLNFVQESSKKDEPEEKEKEE